MTTTPLSFSVVIPMYNEELGAARCIDAVCKQLSSIDARCELIVVEDGSRDSTKSILQDLEPRYANLKVLYHDQNKGYGRALLTGAADAAARGIEYALFMDSDLTNDPADIPKFVEQMAKGIDVIKATRYSDGGGMRGVPFHRALISRVGNFVAGLLFRLPLYDCTNGFRAVKTSLLQQVTFTENNFSVIMEELYKLKPLAKTYARVPVTLTSRTSDQRATSFTYRPRIFIDYLKYPLRSFMGLSH